MPPPLDPADARRLEALRRWASLLDSAFGIPGTGIRFGLDAVIGLVPGLGDAVGGLFSAVLVLQGFRMGVPRIVLARMVSNVALEVLAGAVPFLGDLFDVAWKANLRNVKLLDRVVGRGVTKPTRGDYLFVFGLLLVLLGALMVPVVVLFVLLRLFDRPLI
ncbi:MAG: DUF4112 domain-containing protein [Acidobacteria bacterium]|nr:MAG: DUF4112 domain-containing protein [Acidobacteriota bacterium]